VKEGELRKKDSGIGLGDGEWGKKKGESLKEFGGAVKGKDLTAIKKGVG